MENHQTLALTSGNMLTIRTGNRIAIELNSSPSSISLNPLEVTRLADSVDDLFIPGVKLVGGPGWKMRRCQVGYCLEIASKKIILSNFDARCLCEILRKTLVDLQSNCSHDWLLVSAETDCSDNLTKTFICRYCGKIASRTYYWDYDQEEED